MDILTLHGNYDLASYEDSIRDGGAKPVNIPSLHQNFPSLENSSLHCHHSSAASNDEVAQADDNSKVKCLQDGPSSECVPAAFVEAATVDGTGTYLSKNFVIPVHLSGWTTQLEGNILGEYFGLAMAVCAVGLLRTACLSLETTNTRNSKETTVDMIEADALTPVQRSSLEAKHGREIQKTTCAEEHSATLLQKINCLQEELLDLKRLRLEDSKANEKVVSIFASKEQAWKEERKHFRDDQQLLCQELQRAYLQQEALSLQLEHLRGLEKQPCADCEHREALFSDLKERFREQEFLIMATVEEAQTEQQEKKALADKLASVDSSISQMQEQLSAEAQKHAVELAKHDELINQLQMRIKQAGTENSQLSQELRAAQLSISTLVHEKTECEKTALDTSTEVTELRCSVQRKEDIISAMLKKAKADNEDRTQLERELATIRVKLLQTEKEETFRRLAEVTNRSSSMKKESLRSRNSFGSRSVPQVTGMIEELQKLHDVEVETLHSRYEEHMQMLQKRLNLYQERLTDLEEEILLRMSTDAKHMVAYKEHCLNHGRIMGNECMVIFKESIEAEVATKKFQLGVAKTLIRQFMDSETHREKEIEYWKSLYLASKAALAICKEQELAGAIVPWNPKLCDRLEVKKSRSALKLEHRHWQEFNAFERQIIARDERMDAFRGQLLPMENEMQKRHRQVETHREQEIEYWKNPYLASKAAIAIYKEQEHAGAIVPRNPKLHNRLEVERSRYALKLEQRHWQEINAFERQIIARDERMEAFRGQLLQMENEMQKRRRQVEVLTQSLEDAHNYSRRLVEELLELKHCEENKALGRYAKCSACDGDVEGDICSLQEKVSSLQNLLTEKEMQSMQSLVRKSGDTPSVLQDVDSRFGVAEAQLTDDRIVFGTDRKAEKELPLMKLEQEGSALDHHDLNIDSNSETNRELQEVSYKACLALRRLSSRKQEAQEHTSPGDSMNKEHVKELVEHSAQYSFSHLEVAEESGHVSRVKMEG